MKRNNFFYTLILLLISIDCYTQVGHKVLIYDSNTKLPIAYATIQSIKNDFGTFTVDDGTFSLTSQYGDSLYISCVGYVSKKINVTEIKENKIALNINANQLEPITIKSKRFLKEETFGLKDAKKSVDWGSSSKGDEFAQRFTFPSSQKFYKLKTIEIAVDRFEESIPMVLHIYTMGNDSFPKDELLNKPILITKTNFKKRDKKLVMDITSENVIINDGVCFIGVEWLPIERGQKKPATSTLKLTDAVTEKLTVTRSYYFAKEKWMGAPTISGVNQSNPNNLIIFITTDVFE